jgi:hypothetical protein
MACKIIHWLIFVKRYWKKNDKKMGRPPDSPVHPFSRRPLAVDLTRHPLIPVKKEKR